MKSGIEHIVSAVPVLRSQYESEEHHNLTHGNAFPASPVERQLFYRDDLHLWYQYNGTDWVAPATEAYVDAKVAADIGTHADLTTGVHGLGIGARAYHSENHSIANETYTYLAFDSEIFDTDNIHDLVTNNSRLTCKTAGKYLAISLVTWASNLTGYRVGGIVLNGTFVLVEMHLNGTAAGFPRCLAFTICELAVNDYIEQRVWQNSGGALTAYTDGGGATNLIMFRIG